MSEMRAIDTLHQGRAHAVCCWQFGEVLIDPGPTASIENVLAELGNWQPQAILLTHIHLDHAASAGTLARRWPGVQVYVHELGARHMLDPSRLWDSASRLYGAENMLRLWGKFEPVPEGRLHVLHGGETLTIGADKFDVVYTPGHAKHHVSYFSGDTAFVGDVGGVRVQPGLPAVPPTPPPDIDIELWHQSLALLRERAPRRMGLTHWGLVENVEEQLEQIDRRLDEWAAAARYQDGDTWVRQVEERLLAATSREDFESFHQAVSLDRCYLGLRRYWTKRDEREAASGRA